MVQNPYQYPSVTLSRQYDSSNPLVDVWRGEANKLLYELKNLMTFRKLGQLKMTRIFTDGTTIIAKSIFGQDFIEIYPGRMRFGMAPDAEKEQICIITFMDLPDIVQPMRYPGQIRDDEISGVDYFKTYYTADVTKCESCSIVLFRPFFNYEVPIESQHYDDEPNNHCVISIDPSCFGQVITYDQDEGGLFFIWKAFTEANQFSRTGLGIMLMQGDVFDVDNNIICTVQQKITVDCCEKDIGLRKPVIYCERCLDAIGNFKPCESGCDWTLRPTDMWVWPEIDGSCPPYEWAAIGPGSIEDTSGNELHDSILFYPGVQACNEPVFVKVIDRCGAVYQIEKEPCCSINPPMSFNYTTLEMQCNDSQNLYASGGCPPYYWSLNGGGELSVSPDGTWASYWSPSSNAECSLNPTITVTDCCGSSDSIKIAVNCYTYPSVAYTITRYVDMGRDAGCGEGGEAGLPRKRIHVYTDRYKCDGTLLDTIGPVTPCVCVNSLPACIEGTCTKISGCGPPWCELNTCCYYSSGDIPCNGYIDDVRTPAMITAGCCPLNPGTGEPF